MTCDRPAGHRHGSTNDHSDGCRCPDTLRAHQIRLAKQRRREAQIGLGLRERNPIIPKGPTLAHLRALQKKGHSLPGIAKDLGMSPDTLESLYRKDRAGLRKMTARRILDYQGSSAATVHVDTTPALATTRRLQALAALGHSIQAITALAPIPAGTEDVARFHVAYASQLRKLRTGKIAGTSERFITDVAAAYDQLWDQEPDRSTPAKRYGATHTLNLAQRNGWLPPMYLDDDRMGDPSYRPRIPYDTRYGDKELISQ